MASTPSNRLKLTPSNSPFLHRLSRSPIRVRPFSDASSSSPPIPPRLALKRVIGSTCSSPTGFDTVNSSFAYIAGGAVVVVDVLDDHYRQRFYRARPAAVPVYSVSPIPRTLSTPVSTPKANDSRNRASVAGGHRESAFGLPDWSESPTSGKTWTQRERIKSATCLSLSRDGRFLAVGETGYAPRVLIFGLDDTSSDIPLVSISEHSFGVMAVAWSSDSRYLASLGSANDGFLYMWKIDQRTGAAKLFQQNRCTSYVRGMLWLGSSSLITFGVRHIKVWRVEEGSASSTSPTKSSRYANDSGFMTPPSHQPPSQQHRTLPGRNILLGTLLEATFSSAVSLADGRALICSETGDVCLLESTSKQMKLIRLREVGFSVTCISIRRDTVYIGGKSGQSLAVDLDELLLDCRRDSPVPDLGVSTPYPSTPSRQSMRSSPSPCPARNGLVAMGFLPDHVVTIDSRRSIDIFSSADYVPGTEPASDITRIPITGYGEPIMGIQALSVPNKDNAAFCTWSGSGSVLLWSLSGDVKSSFDVPVEQVATENELEPPNQLTVVRATKGAKLFVMADRLGVLRVFDFAQRKFILETKAHSADCQSISIYEDDTKLLLASCGRDRTTQLFHRLPNGTIEHFQTLEFPAKVVQVLLTPDNKVITCSFDRTMQVHDLVSKADEPSAMAAIPERVITLKASPSSMALAPDAKSVYTSLLDRTICQYDIATGRLMNSFKCFDEGGAETALLDALIYGKQVGAAAANGGSADEAAFLLGLSNTDKSVRIYDAQTGAFLDREWGHTEAINGVALIDDGAEPDSAAKDEAASGGCRKVVSVGSDGTIMIWSLDLCDSNAQGSATRDPSPSKDALLPSTRPPLRRVLSKAELADFQKGSPLASPLAGGGSGSGSGSGSSNGNGSGSGRRSPARSLGRKSSRYNLASGSSGPARTPIALLLNNSTSPITEDAASRRVSSGSGDGSPPMPVSPKAKVRRRPSLPAMSTTSTPTGAGGSARGIGLARKKTSVSNLRASYGFGSLSMATEQTCRQLRAYRKRLASTDPVAQGMLMELDQELRLTVAALGDRAIRSKAMSDELDGLLDEKLERLVSLLDEKWRLQHESKHGSSGKRPPHQHHDRDNSAASAASAASATSATSGCSLASEGHTEGDGRGSSNSFGTGNTSLDEDGERERERERERPRTAGVDSRPALATGSVL